MALSTKVETCYQRGGDVRTPTKDPRGTIESILADTEFMKADEQFRARFHADIILQRSIREKMASSLEASAIIGNLYTASMYMGLRSMLEFEFKKGTDLEQKRIGFGSYGDGSRLWSLAERV